MIIKRMTAVVAAALVLAGCTGCGAGGNGSGTAAKGEPVALLDTSEMFSSRDVESGYDEAECTIITFDGSSANVTGSGAKASGGTVTISGEGNYLLSGELKDGSVIVDAGGDDKVRLILKGVNISSSTGAAINVKQADKVFVTLARESENTLSNIADSEITDDADAVIYSKDDLTVNGEGSLTINANSGHGIVSKDDLVISGGSYTITSEKKALDANDSIRVAGGKFTLNSGTDALHAGNEDASKGYIYIAGGTFAITSGTDGMDASGVIQIDNGTFTITTGGGSANASTRNDGQPSGDWGMWGGRGRHMSTTEGDNDVTRLSASGAGTTASSDSSSAKGLKSDSSVAINSGTVTIDSSDDAIHSNNQVSITGGTISIFFFYDWLNSDLFMDLCGGSVSIAKSYEGIEAMCIDISGGIISVTASDDGLNAAGGNDQSSMNGRPGQNQFAAREGVYIRISGGSLTVDAGGDGVDSNGSVEVSGGETYVSGSTNNGNAALDFNGSATITGGTFIAAGMSGMAQNFGSGSTQGTMLVNVGGQQGGSAISLMDSKGKVLASFTPAKAYNSVVVSTPDVKQGGTYTLQTGSSSTEVKMDSLVYGQGGGMGGPGMGGRGGMGGPGRRG